MVEREGRAPDIVDSMEMGICRIFVAGEVMGARAGVNSLWTFFHLCCMDGHKKVQGGPLTRTILLTVCVCVCVCYSPHPSVIVE